MIMNAGQICYCQGAGTVSLTDSGARYQDALETIIHYEYRIAELEADLDAFQEAYEEVSNKYYG